MNQPGLQYVLTQVQTIQILDNIGTQETVCVRTAIQTVSSALILHQIALSVSRKEINPCS
jgi:hypothetical protein